jgi:hypothetical protein
MLMGHFLRLHYPSQYSDPIVWGLKSTWTQVRSDYLGDFGVQVVVGDPGKNPSIVKTRFETEYLSAERPKDERRRCCCMVQAIDRSTYCGSVFLCLSCEVPEWIRNGFESSLTRASPMDITVKARSPQIRSFTAVYSILHSLDGED